MRDADWRARDRAGVPAIPDETAALVHHTIVPASAVPERKGVLAVLSGQEHAGKWALARKTRIVAALGSVELDLREADIAEGESEIEVVCVLGSVEIVVPPGIRVISDGATLAGTFELRADTVEALPADAPVVRIQGSVYFGAVDTRVQLWGETERAARKRRKRRR